MFSSSFYCTLFEQKQVLTAYTFLNRHLICEFLLKHHTVWDVCVEVIMQVQQMFENHLNMPMHYIISLLMIFALTSFMSDTTLYLFYYYSELKWFLEKKNKKQAILWNWFHTFILKKTKKRKQVNWWLSLDICLSQLLDLYSLLFTAATDIKSQLFFKPMPTVRGALWALQTSRRMISVHTNYKSPSCSVELQFFCTQEKQDEKKRIFFLLLSEMSTKRQAEPLSLLVSGPRPRQSLLDGPRGEGCSWHLPQVYRTASYWRGRKKGCLLQSKD